MPNISEVSALLRPEFIAHTADHTRSGGRRLVLILASLFILALALVFIRYELKSVSFSDITEALRSIPVSYLGFAVIATGVSYVAISVFDTLALDYADTSSLPRRSRLASFATHTISNTLGMSAFTGNAIRSRLYASWGLSGLDIAVIVFMTSLISFLCGLTLLSLGLLTDNVLARTVFHIPPVFGHVIGAVVLGVIIWVVRDVLSGAPHKILGSVNFKRPKTARLGAQFAASLIDWIACAAALYILLPQELAFTFLTFLPVFVGAQYIGALSGLPGGIGVFEAVFLLLVPPADAVTMAAGLVAYRAIYYILPLLVSGILLSIRYAFRAKPLLIKGGAQATDFMETLAPLLFSTLTFVTGVVMLVSAATPNILDNIQFIANWVPTTIVEASHLLASATGTLLVLTAMGLRRRLKNAMRLGVVLFILGALFTVFKGGDPMGAAVMVILGLCLFLSKDAFYRTESAQGFSLTLPRFGAILGSAGFALWAGFYAYKNQAYSSDLWWRFGLQDDASRFLRASALVGALLLVYFLWNIIRPSPARYAPDTTTDTLTRVRDIIQHAEGANADANLAVMGDKQFLFSETGRSFIMYGVKGRNWVAMGEPVGLASERKSLIWAFRRRADQADAWPSFYSVRGENLSDFVDIGLTVQKIGEVARVPLKNYSLEGPSKSRMRQTYNRAKRDGCSFEIMSVGAETDDMRRLEAVSDAWLNKHNGKEKIFSLGRFDPAVLAQQPIAVVRLEGRIIAFANLWVTPDKSEIAIDLMRYEETSVGSIMNYLFAEIMVWASGEGYGYFSLGLAPLSGLEGDNLAPFMSKFGALIFKHGGKFYGFEGLRAFKDKFDPEWEPVYLAAPNQLVMPQALGNLALLSSGGVLGLLQK